MCKDLRKVTYQLRNYENYPYSTPKQLQEMEELSKERHGYFHRWVEDMDYSKEIPFIKALALVEDVESGKMYEVETHNMRFTLDWQ